MLRELYELVYGIADHINDENPLNIVMKQDAEYVEAMPYKHIMDQFIKLGVFECTGVSLDDFLK